MGGTGGRRPDDPHGEAAGIPFPAANIVAVAAIANVFESCLGPSAMDKLIVPHSTAEGGDRRGMDLDGTVVTGDGATVLDALPLDHPIAPVLRRIVGPERPGDTAVVGKDIHDGITSSIVLLGALLTEAQALLDIGVHPNTIRRGYQMGLDVALAVLDGETRRLDELPDTQTAERAIAMTAMTGNDLAGLRETWATLVVEAVDLVGMPDEVTLAIRAVRDGSITDSRLVRGAVLTRNERANDAMPRRVEDATVLVIGGAEGYGGLQDPHVRGEISISLESPDAVADFEGHWEERRERIVDRLEAVGVDVVVARTGISTPFQHLLADRGILGIRAVNQLHLRQVAAATGARIVKDPTDIDPEFLGSCGLVEERRREPRKQRRARRRMVVFDDCPEPKSVALLLHGVSGQIADQADTQLRKSAMAVASARGERGRVPGVVPGGGAADGRIALALREEAMGHESRVQLALEAFATAVESFVAALAKNAGIDPIDARTDHRAAAAGGLDHAGLSLPAGAVVDVVDAGIIDPTETRRRVYTSSVEVANMVLNIDDAIDAHVSAEPPDPDEARYDDAAEQMRDHQRRESRSG